MSEIEALRADLSAYRQQFKACQRVMRTTGQMFADLEERLQRLENAKPDEEAQRDGNNSHKEIALR